MNDSTHGKRPALSGPRETLDYQLSVENQKPVGSERKVLEMTVAEFLQRLSSGPPSESDPWIDVQHDPLKRRLVRAAERGDLAVYRIGRQILVRQSSRDAFIQSHRITAKRAVPSSPTSEPVDGLAKMIAAAGLRRVGGSR